MLGNLMLLLSSADLFQIIFFKKIISETLSVSNGLDPDRTDVLSVLIWVQTVCKGY